MYTGLNVKYSQFLSDLMKIRSAGQIFEK